jgi:hypothetical protein
MSDPATAVALKVGLDVFTRVTPKGFAWIKSRLVGRDLLIVGQPRAGKTSLVRYIQYGVFAEAETARTRAIKKTAAFTVKVGRNESLALEVRKAIDTVGQVSPAEHARLAKQFRPHILVLVLDASGPWEGSEERSARYYLEEFFDYYSEAYRQAPVLRRRLRAIYIVLNKRDRLDEKRSASLLKKAKDLVQGKIRSAMGTLDMFVLESSLFEGFDGGKSANAIIGKIALRLKEG